MNEQLLILFICLSIVNVVIQTANHIITLKCNKYIAAISNAIAYGLYTVVLIYTVCDLPLLVKALIVAAANLVGVFTVKLIEEKSQKEKLWKIDMTIPTPFVAEVDEQLKAIPHHYMTITPKHTVFTFFCSTREQTERVKDSVKNYNAKYFVSESKTELF